MVCFAPQIQRMIKQVEEAADNPRLAVIRSFTFARGGWHDVPLQGMVAGTFRRWTDELADKPDEEVKAELDDVIPAYFANDECEALREMTVTLSLANFLGEGDERVSRERHHLVLHPPQRGKEQKRVEHG